MYVDLSSEISQVHLCNKQFVRQPIFHLKNIPTKNELEYIKFLIYVVSTKKNFAVFIIMLGQLDSEDWAGAREIIKSLTEAHIAHLLVFPSSLARLFKEEERGHCPYNTALIRIKYK